MSAEITDTKWLAITTAEYAALQRIVGAAEAIAAMTDSVSASILRDALADYPSDAVPR